MFRSIAFRGITKELLDELLEGCQVISYDYRYLYLNKAARKQSRLPDENLINRQMTEVYPGIEKTKMFKTLKQCMENRTAKFMENEFHFPDGSKAWFELRFEPVPEGIFILSIDISERKQAEANLNRTQEQLRQSQKMEAIGQLASGAAHFYSNLLTVIAFCSEIVIKKMPSSNAFYKRIVQIKEACDEASSLTYQLFAFSRQQVMETKVININTVVNTLKKILQHLIGEDIKLVLELDQKLGNIKADLNQMEQVILNLVVNARDAMPNGGRLTIETSNIVLTESNDIQLEAGPYTMMTISDNGHGMDRATQAHIFEPFFSTKKDKGSGLGLSTAFGIVKQSEGSIWFYSEVGKGTVFKIYLPLVDEKIKTEKLHADYPSPEGNETILLVEDEDKVREVTAFALRMFGYKVMIAANGKDAIKICKQYKDPVHLLISDVVMPEMGGRAVAEKILNLQPKAKVLYMSGYMDDTVLRQGIIQNEVAFIQKPFTPDSLGRKVRQILDNK